MLALTRRCVLSLIWSIGVLFCLSTPSLAAELEIEILSPGDGIAVEKGMYAKVHYQGRLSDGKIFDDSLARDTPFTFILGAGEVIEGWDIGIEGMEVGERRQLIVPPELGYGLRGAGNVIPPNATLTFDIYLIAIRWPPKLTELDANMLASAIAEDQVFIDIRSADARASSGVIEGAVMITGFDSSGQLHPNFQREFADLIKSLNAPFTLYDEDGEAASYLGNALVQQLGFEKVSYLKDGIYGWREAGMPLVDYTP